MLSPDFHNLSFSPTESRISAYIPPEAVYTNKELNIVTVKSRENIDVLSSAYQIKVVPSFL
jgi:hypothetical protein